MNQITTLTFFRFETFADKMWAFQMMQFAHADLRSSDGQTFYKLMGSGKGLGFNPLPDWSVYALLQVWDSEADAERFFGSARIFAKYRAHAAEVCTIRMRTLTAKGLWSGLEPFTPASETDGGTEKIAVITRATIKVRRLPAFWRFVPRSQEPLKNAEGLIYTKGIGEAPIVRMATFSVWESEESMKAFAYKTPEHREAITKTRELGWYGEELFARFRPYASEGTIGGRKIV
jgi:heme-degrading monooxygenase HmoA